jgi:hypothetical protein
MAAFHCETNKLQAPAMSGAPPQTLAAGSIWFSIVEGCDGDNCPFLEELIALPAPGTTVEQCLAQLPKWKLDGILCDKRHQIVLTLPEPRTYIGQL